MSTKLKFKIIVFVPIFLLIRGFAQQLPSVELVSNKFLSEGKPWFSLAVNYQVGIFTDDEKSFWVGPNHGYRSDNKRCCNNQLDARMALFADFARIREMGFNTVRICGMELFATPSSIDKKIWARGKKGKELSDIQVLASKKNIKYLAQMAKIVVEEAHDAGLQVIFLTGGANLQRVNIRDKYNDWLITLCDSLKKTTPIFSIDLYNEPAYSNTSNLSKIELNEITKKWNTTIKKRLPKTLTTIGLIGPEDVLNWDPDALIVDFINFHLYPKGNDFEYIAASLYWISQTVKKPWIIGETSYSGGNDTTQKNKVGNETDQKNYALFSINRALCRGAQGYSWWAYRDVFWGMPEDNMGLVNHAGKDKEIASTFLHFNEIQKPESCPTPDDLHYYRMEYTDYIVSGSVENEKGQPIANAVVCGWAKEWKNFRWTVTDKKGSFRLGSNSPITFVKISAYGCDVISRIVGQTAPEIALKTVVLKHWSDIK